MNLVKLLILHQYVKTLCPPASYPFSADRYRDMMYDEMRYRLLIGGEDINELNR